MANLYIHVICEPDRLFSGRKQCAKCCETLQPDELVMRGREHLFHTRCFSCHVCQTHLIKGSTFGMVGALIFCQQHYQQGSQSASGFNVNHNNNNISGHSFPQPQQPAETYMTQHHQEPFGSPHHLYDHHLHQHYGQSLVQPATTLVEPMETNGTKLYGSPASASPAASLKNQRIRTKRRPSNKSDMISIMNGKKSILCFVFVLFFLSFLCPFLTGIYVFCHRKRRRFVHERRRRRIARHVVIIAIFHAKWLRQYDGKHQWLSLIHI